MAPTAEIHQRTQRYFVDTTTAAAVAAQLDALYHGPISRERLALARPQLKTALQDPVGSPQASITHSRRIISRSGQQRLPLTAFVLSVHRALKKMAITRSSNHSAICASPTRLVLLLQAVACLPACFCRLAGHATQAKSVWSVMVPGTFNSRTCLGRDVIVWTSWCCKRTAIHVSLASLSMLRDVAAQLVEAALPVPD